jgi:hypothetical protein
MRPAAAPALPVWPSASTWAQAGTAAAPRIPRVPVYTRELQATADELRGQLAAVQREACALRAAFASIDADLRAILSAHLSGDAAALGRELEAVTSRRVERVTL